MKHSELDDFAADAVNFYPIANANSVFSHQHEPAKKCDDEILHGDGEARAHKSQNRPELARRTENHQQNQEKSEQLKRQRCGVAERRVPTCRWSVDIFANK